MFPRVPLKQLNKYILSVSESELMRDIVIKTYMAVIVGSHREKHPLYFVL